jgi:ribonuclease HII
LKKENSRARYLFDARHRKRFTLLAGGDEAGRGPWAGPVSAAIVIFPPKIFHPAVNDSKKILEKNRLELSLWIKEHALTYGIGRAEPKEIDEINILEATRLAFIRAYEALQIKPDKILFDAIVVKGIACKQEAFIKGDGRSFLIGAASILAKVERDGWMTEYDKKFPEYGFARHKGYGTAFHQDALKKYGPCAIHRMSFNPIQKALKKDS